MFSPRATTRRVGAVAGFIGPALFGAVVLVLTLAQYPFMRSLGWDPVLHPTFDWPSGLALGPLGWVMTTTFIVCGLLMSMFAWGLRGQLQDTAGQVGTILMTWAGVAMMCLAFTTDRVITPMPISWHGRLHDMAFMALGLMLIPAMISLAVSFQHDMRWRKLAAITWITFGLAMPTFAIKGLVFYAFLAAMLAWNELTALQLWKRTREET
jgi:hypothetical protein